MGTAVTADMAREEELLSQLTEAQADRGRLDHVLEQVRGVVDTLQECYRRRVYDLCEAKRLLEENAEAQHAEAVEGLSMWVPSRNQDDQSIYYYRGDGRAEIRWCSKTGLWRVLILRERKENRYERWCIMRTDTEHSFNSREVQAWTNECFDPLDFDDYDLPTWNTQVPMRSEP